MTSRKTVLVVEDDDDLRSIFTTNLSMAGFVVRQAANGMEALQLIDSAPPDIVLLDLGLPHVTGHDVLSEIKAHAHTRDIPILVVTGRDVSLPGISPECILLKPVDAAELLQQVKRCLGLKSEPPV